MKIGFYDLVQGDLHKSPPGHPENSKRLSIPVDFVLKSDIGGDIELFKNDLDNVNLDPLYIVHSRRYLERIERISKLVGGALDGDTYLSSGSWTAAINIARASIRAVELLAQGKYSKIHIAGRPPGHHAEFDYGKGFCLINNNAVAAQAAVSNHGINRVAIVDYDVHHGNGTQNIFYSRSDILYISLHQYPFFPGSGTKSDTGIDAGDGYTINFPLPFGKRDEDYLRIFVENIVPALEKYKPELIIVISGFDAHKDDYLGGMNLTENGFKEMTLILAEIAERFSDGRILSFFEGGYNPTANAACLYHHLQGLKGVK